MQELAFSLSGGPVFRMRITLPAVIGLWEKVTLLVMFLGWRGGGLSPTDSG
jgi:hypothetical protein